MTLTEKAAYIRGLIEGLDVDKDSKENKIIAAIVDLLDDMALTVSDLEDTQGELQEYVEELDEDLGELEDEVYGDEDEDEDDGFNYKTECPNCGEEILLDDEILKDGAFECPHCGETIDFSDEGCDCCDCEDEGCDCGCEDHK